VYVGDQSLHLIEGGKLGDVAPTLLALMKIPQPEAMAGQCLIQQ
jgi:2,3-bisphosphoglycerate-independent phosphoglycerate mutase